MCCPFCGVNQEVQQPSCGTRRQPVHVLHGLKDFHRLQAYTEHNIDVVRSNSIAGCDRIYLRLCRRLCQPAACSPGCLRRPRLARPTDRAWLSRRRRCTRVCGSQQALADLAPPKQVRPLQPLQNESTVHQVSEADHLRVINKRYGLR